MGQVFQRLHNFVKLRRNGAIINTLTSTTNNTLRSKHVHRRYSNAWRRLCIPVKCRFQHAASVCPWTILPPRLQQLIFLLDSLDMVGISFFFFVPLNSSIHWNCNSYCQKEIIFSVSLYVLSRRILKQKLKFSLIVFKQKNTSDPKPAQQSQIFTHATVTVSSLREEIPRKLPLKERNNTKSS